MVPKCTVVGHIVVVVGHIGIAVGYIEVVAALECIEAAGHIEIVAEYTEAVVAGYIGVVVDRSPVVALDSIAGVGQLVQTGKSLEVEHRLEEYPLLIGRRLLVAGNFVVGCLQELEPAGTYLLVLESTPSETVNYQQCMSLPLKD